MNNHLRRFIFAALFACIIPAALSSLAPSSFAVHAQDLDDVTINGRVIDQNNALVPGATVTAVLVETGAERTVTTDSEGRYRIIELNPGLYTVRVAATGFATAEKTDLTTIAGQNVQLDFTLQPANVVAEQTTISEADAPLVDTTRTVVGGTVTTQEIEDLPNVSRSPLDLVFTLGGVTEEPLSTRDLAEDRNSNPQSTPEEAGTFALSGGPAYSNNITIDGLDNNDDRAARERFQPSIEAVEEVQIITNQFSSEYGRASGGRINIRTRGGSNKYRGRAFYFFRNDIFNANTSNNQARGLPRLPLEQHNPGFTFSGPVRLPFYDGRKRTFFFTAYEYDTTLDSAFVNTLVPVEQNPLFRLPAPTSPDSQDEIAPTGSKVAKVAPFFEGLSTPVKNNTLTTRIDHRYTDLHNASLVYQLGRQKNLRQFGGGNRLAETLIARTRNTDAISYTDNYVFSARLVNQLRFQISRLTPAVEAGGGNQTPVVLIDIEPSEPTLDTQQRSNPLIAGTSTTGATDRRENRLQFQDSVSYVLGSHSLKFGGDIQRIRSTFIDLSDASGTFDFDSAGDFIANTPSRFRQNFQTESVQRNTYLGVFIQDEWRLMPNLTVSYGLRYERESIIRDTNNFGPRFAIAYDPFKTGKTVIRAGAGIFYNRALLRTIDDFTLGSQQLFLDTNDIPVADREDVLKQIVFPEVLTPDSTIVQKYGSLNTSFSRRLDPTLRIPESYQANVGFEREIGRRFVFEANYTYNRGIHLWREFNANAPRLPAGFSSLPAYLLSRDFENFRPCAGCSRPLFNGTGAGEFVRFQLASVDPTNANTVGRVVEFGVPVSLINLNSINSTTALNAALAALNNLRPDPTRTEVEQLASIGNSFYHGLTLELRSRFRRSKRGLSYSFRAAYTLSRLIDDGIVNTSDALTPGDFRAERSRSLLDRRHRFVLSGTFETPPYLGKLRFSPILRLSSGAPFNISIGGTDRNLDDVGNDRPIFNGDLELLRSRAPGEPLDPRILAAFSLPTIGQTGNLPRNAGLGPGQFLLDINVTREFRLSERLRLRPVVEVDNLLNKTVFSFGTEFINFSSFSPTATPAQRQAFLDSFLVTTRTLRPRQVRLGIRFDF